MLSVLTVPKTLINHDEAHPRVNPVFSEMPADDLAKAFSLLEADQLRELIGNIIEHVDGAEESSIRFVEQRSTQKLLKQLSVRRADSEDKAVCRLDRANR